MIKPDHPCPNWQSGGFYYCATCHEEVNGPDPKVRPVSELPASPEADLEGREA